MTRGARKREIDEEERGERCIAQIEGILSARGECGIDHLQCADGLTFFTFEFFLSYLHCAGRFVAFQFRLQDSTSRVLES